MNPRCRLGLIIATRLEAEAFIEGLSLRQIEKTPFKTFQSDTTSLVISGIGKANAAMATGFACMRFRPVCICNPGAAGATGRDHALGTWYHVSSVIEPDRPSLRTGKPWRKDLSVLGGFQYASIATQDHPVLAPEERQLIAPIAHMVDMESASVVQAARKFQVPCYLFKFISDTPDHTDGEAIVENIKKYRKSFFDFFKSSVIPLLK
jgi:nucleoside phosphorylase